MDKKLEARIRRLEKMLNRKSVKYEEMPLFKEADIRNAVRDAHTAILFLKDASSNLGQNAWEAVDTITDNMIDELQAVADNWNIEVGTY